MTVEGWAARWHVTGDCLAELIQTLAEAPPVSQPSDTDFSEEAVQNRIRLSRVGIFWRNNVGSFIDDRNVPVRYGLANESSKLNKVVKSSDLIGITPLLIGPQHVGQVAGIFTAVETKRGGWRFRPNDRRAVAQQRFLQVVAAAGGRAMFANSLDAFESYFGPRTEEGPKQ